MVIGNESADFTDIDVRNHPRNIGTDIKPSLKQIEDVVNMNKQLLYLPTAIEGFRFKAVKNIQGNRQIIAVDPNEKEYDAGYLLNLTTTNLSGSETNILDFLERYVKSLFDFANSISNKDLAQKYINRALKIQKLYTGLQSIIENKEDIVDITEYIDINSRIYSNVVTSKSFDELSTPQYKSLAKTPALFKDILDSEDAERWKVNGEFLVVTRTTDGEFRKLLGLKNIRNSFLIDKYLESAKVRTSIDTQFAILVKRPGKIHKIVNGEKVEKDNYIFLGVKGRDLFDDEKKEFIKEIEKIEKSGDVEKVKRLVDKLNNEVFLKSTYTVPDGNTVIPLHLKFAHRGGKKIIIFAEPKISETSRKTKLPDGFSWKMDVKDAIDKHGSVRINMAQNVFSEFADLKDNLYTNASPKIWKTYLTLNALNMPEVKDIVDTIPGEEPVLPQEPPPGEGPSTKSGKRRSPSSNNQGTKPTGDDGIINTKIINEVVPIEVASQLSEISKRIKEIVNVDVNFLNVLKEGLDLEESLYGMFRKNIIYLNSKGFPKGTEWHEAFHAIFSLLPKNEQIRVLSIAKRMSFPKQEEIIALRDFHMGLAQNYLAAGKKRKAQFHLKLAGDDKFLFNKVLEENVADRFQEYMNDQPTTFFQKFFAKLKQLVRALFGIVDTNEFSTLFENIRGGKYRYMTPDGRIESAALIPGGATVTETDRLIRTLTNAYMNREEIEEMRYNLSDDPSSYRSPAGFKAFVTEELDRFRNRVITALNEQRDLRISKIEESGLSKEEKEEQFDNDDAIMALKNYWDEDREEWVPGYLFSGNDEIIINMVIQHAKFRKIDTTSDNVDEASNRDFDASEMEKSPQSNKAAIAVKDTMASLYYLQDNEVIPINYIEAFNNLLMNLSGRKNIEQTLFKLSDDKTEFGKTMKTIYDKYMDDTLFRTQMRVAFDRSFRKAINVILNGKTVSSENFVKNANFRDHIQRQVELWKAEAYSKIFVNKNANIKDNDIYKASGIRLEEKIFEDPEAEKAIEALKTFIPTLKDEKSLKRNDFTAVLEELAKYNIRYRLDLGELNFKNAEDKPMHSIMQNSWIFNRLDDAGVENVVFTGTEYFGERSDYKGITPKKYLMSVLAMYMNQEDNKGQRSPKKYYTIQQFEAKNTVPVFAGEDYMNLTTAELKNKVEAEIKRQKVFHANNLAELYKIENPIDLIEEYHLYSSDELKQLDENSKPRIATKFEELFEKPFTNSVMDIIAMVEKSNEGVISRSYLPRGFRFFNLPYANESLNYSFNVDNFYGEESFFNLDKKVIYDYMKEFDISGEEIMETFNVGYREEVDPETKEKKRVIDRVAMDNFFNLLVKNNYINKMEIFGKLGMDLNQFKSFANATKRGGGLLASGPNHGDGSFYFSIVPDSQLEFLTGNAEEGTEKTLSAEEVDGQGAESAYERLNRYIRQGFAVDSPRSNNKKADEAYQRYLIMKAYAEDDREFIEKEKINGDAVLKVDKTVGYGDDYYMKTSIHVLTRYFSSIPAEEGDNVIRVVYDKNGEPVRDEYGDSKTISYTAKKDRNGKWYLPMPGREYEWNILNQMSINRGKEGAPQYIQTVFAKSAVKKGARSIAQGEDDNLELRPLSFNYADYRVQQENPSGKVKIKDGVQLIQLINAGFKSNISKQIEVSDKLIAEIKDFNTKLYAKDREIRINGKTFNPFVEYLQSTLQSSANNERIIEFFEKEGNGFKYSVSLPIIKQKFESLLMSYFNSNVAAHKTTGGKYTLVSAKYYKAMVYEDPERGDRVINTKEYNDLLAKSKKTGVLITVRTRNLNFTKQSNALSEVVLTEEYLDNLGIDINEWNRLKLSENPEEKILFDKISTFVGYRIPTQGQQSMMPARIIDFLPRHHGSTVIAPAELTKISGSDYDVDSLFAHMYAFYKDAAGKLKLFTKSGRESFVKSMAKNSYIKAIAEQKENPEIDNKLFLISEFRQAIRTLYKRLKSDYFKDMPTKEIREKKLAEKQEILDEIEEYGKDIERMKDEVAVLEEIAAMEVVDYINSFPDTKIPEFIVEGNLNELLDDRIATLTSPNGIDLLNTPADDLLKDFWKNYLQDKFNKVNNLLVFSSLGTQLSEYITVSTGTVAVGGAANIAKSGAFIIKNGVDIKQEIKDILKSIYRGVDFETATNIEKDIILKKEGKQLLLELRNEDSETTSKLNSTSSNTSSSVDNANDQTLRKYFLNGKNIAHASTLNVLGFGIKRLGLLLVSPANKYLSGYLESNASFEKKDSEVIQDFIDYTFGNIVPDRSIDDNDLLTTLDNKDRIDSVLQKIVSKVSNAKKKKDFTEVKAYMSSISKEDIELLTIQKAICKLMRETASITEDIFQINTILNFNKEVGSNFGDIEKLLNSFKRINSNKFSFEKFDILNNKGISQVKESAKQLKEYVSTKVISQSKNAQKAIDSLAQSIADTSNEYGMILYKNDMADAWIEYLGMKGLAKYEGIVRKITPEIIKVNDEVSFEETFSILDEDIINGKKVIAEYNKALEYMVEFPDSFKIGKLFEVTKGNKTYPFDRLIIDTFQNLNTEDRKSMVDGFDEIYFNPKTRAFAKYLITHVAAHDNFRYVFGSVGDKMKAKYYGSINKIYNGDAENNLIGMEKLFNLAPEQFEEEFKNFFGVSLDESLADFGQFFFSDGRNATNLNRINDEENRFRYSYLNDNDEKATDSFGFFQERTGNTKILDDGIIEIKQPVNIKNFKLKYIPKYFVSKDVPYRYIGYSAETNAHYYAPVDTSLNYNGVKLNLYQYDFQKATNFIKNRLEQIGEEVKALKLAQIEDAQKFRAGTLGEIKLNIIDEWVQTGKATTTVRSDSYHNSFYKGDGVYVSEGKNNLVNINYLGKIQLINDKIVGEGIEMDLDEFAEKEGWSSWQAFSKGLPGEKPSIWAGQTLANGGIVNLYAITPANVNETTGIQEFDKLPSVFAKPTMFYAGIGSRETPPEFQEFMAKLAKAFERLGFTLRSGNANGADKAFESGTAKKVIFPGGMDIGMTELKIARALHGNPAAVDKLKDKNGNSIADWAWKTMSRNIYQIFGKDLDIPSDFVVCWTPDGAETTKERGRETGGTGQAIDMANRKGIPVFNLAKEGSYEKLMEYVNKLAEANEKGIPVRDFINDALNSSDNSLASSLVTTEGVKVISEDYGVVQAETNPFPETTEYFVDLIRPQIQAQLYKENKGKFANEMFHYGLMWSRTNAKAGPVQIQKFEGVNNNTYNYHALDQNGNPLPAITDLQPIINEIEKSLGIDMSNYDSVIGNLYLDDQYVYPHKDTTESVTARNYPVVVYTIGNDSGLGIVDNNNGKMTFANTYDTVYLPSGDKLTGYTNEILTKNGSIYTFGMNGKGRFELTHSTPTNSKKTQQFPPITLPNGQVVTNYTITLTFRRAADLIPNMPVSPARLVESSTLKEVPNFQSTISPEIEKFLDEDFDIYLPVIQKMKGYKNIETKKQFLALDQEKQDSLVKRLCKS